MFDSMIDPHYPVLDDYGREIGTVQPVTLADQTRRSGTPARSTGPGLGNHPDRDDAHAAIRLDWSLGRPRNPKTGQRYRPVHAGLDAGIAPVYLER